MAKKDYLPHSQSAYLRWHDAFSAALASAGAGVGVAAAETTLTTTHNQALHARTAEADKQAGLSKAATAELNRVIADSQQAVRTLAQRVKLHGAYTQAIGQQLGIEGPDTAVDLSTAQPQLDAEAKPGGQVVIGFTKDQSDGVNLYSQRDGDSGFVFLARDTSSPYVDNRPLLATGKPETRKYKAVYVVGDDEVGQFSDELTVTARP